MDCGLRGSGASERERVPGEAVAAAGTGAQRAEEEEGTLGAWLWGAGLGAGGKEDT